MIQRDTKWLKWHASGELVHTGAGFGHYLDEMLVQQCALDSCWHVNHVCSPHSKS